MKASPTWKLLSMCVAGCVLFAHGEGEIHRKRRTILLGEPTHSLYSRYLIHSMNGFSVDMYKRMSEGQIGSLVISPVSVFTAMTMVMLGAGGSTKEEMEQSLVVKELSGAIKPMKVHGAMKRYLARSGVSSENTTTSIANAIFMRPGFPVTPYFSSSLKNYYHSEVHTPITADALNAWVTEKTQGEITKVIEKVEDDVVMILLNAVYFKGQWMYAFKKEDTRKGDFKVSSQKTVQVEFMWRRGIYKMLEPKGIKAQILALPYQGERYAMFIALPNEDSSLSELHASMTTENAKSVSLSDYRMWASTLVEVRIPKFSVETNRNMNEILKNMGMKEAFDEQLANFTKMTPAKTYIGQVDHVAKIDVDEEGTVAAAVTVVKVALSKSASNRPKYRKFIADRPFIFVVQDTHLRVPLFMGHYSGP